MISKKRDFFDQALAFLPPGKPDLYKSHLYFFFLNTVLLPLSSTLSFYKGYKQLRLDTSNENFL